MSDAGAAVVDLVTSCELDALERGAWILGAGGGGETTVGRMLADRAIGEGVPLMGRAALARVGVEAHVLPIGIIGASSTVGAEFLPSGQECLLVARKIEELTRVALGAVVAMQAGGINALTGLAAAADLGLPLLDADLAGGAVPRLDQLSNGSWEEPVVPVVLVDAVGRVAVFDTADSDSSLDSSTLERLVRSFVGVSTGWAAIGFRPIQRDRTPDLVVWGSMTRAINLGRAQATQNSDWDHYQPELDSQVLAVGRVVGLHRVRDTKGWCLVETDRGQLCRLDMQTEYLLVTVDGLLAASVPDVIVVLERHTGIPLATDNLRLDFEVVVIRLAALPYPDDPRLQHELSPAGYGLESSSRK
ncbi:hypothetical protein AN948_01120 [Rhodococcus sp. ADH]|nr:hypothetical protein AN948_01120 [Rhodococcus sp. ADH]RGP44593.1 hypothetical protein AWH04_27930 [Rhodococcus erythropolis]